MSSTLLEEMRASLGVQETPGSDSNPEIVAYFADCGWKLSELGEDSTVAWCAARLGSALKRCGYPVPPKNVNLSARTYATYGVACDPQPGAIGVIPRGKAGSWMGHVFVIERVRPDGRWDTIGGNQGTLGAVTRAIVDPRKVQVLGVRKPVEATVPALRKAGSTEIKKGDQIQNAGWAVTVIPAVIATVKSLLEPITVPEFGSLPEALSWWQQVLAGANALVGLVMAQPWLFGTGFVGLVLLLAGRRLKAARLEKHAAGIPLSSQVAELEVV